METKAAIKDAKEHLSQSDAVSAQTKALKDQLFGGLRTYILYFRAGNRPPMQKVFFHKGDKQSAIDRGRLHCERMNYKFCGVYPFIVDLDAQEQLRNDEIYEENY